VNTSQTYLESTSLFPPLGLAPERNSSIFYWGSFDIHERPVEASEAGILSALRRKGLGIGG
jgi:hypothetical protein